MGDPDRLPPWVTRPQRPFPDASLLLLPGANPALAGGGLRGPRRPGPGQCHYIGMAS